mmetsp:Transcript_20247/g.24999  ORF Transcript_20247/g.24999 Transcript_20247/m.24999 type:complete len:86 (+) Transcript_20247:167-424(+)|eukprot:CAMPEP_0170472740 /NCGR_PEP_ID=MMETSP0123-20130129/14736_1 /TAXON_ID=182087 /ORGANISM="Favella ehrenbergii, Strain Fehren 1" /LENGTH=85 /DNA_ID=CAMNT_0010741243 /DNA_START=349 /DNA_END=606 /DNA_ORIENTATION=-
MSGMVQEDISKQQTAGTDFNDFVLAHNGTSSDNKAKWMTGMYTIKQMQLLHRVALMQVKVNEMMFQSNSDKKERRSLKANLDYSR